MTKKRYTKKKISFSKDSHTLPYDKYRVEWVDCVSDSGWAEHKEFTNMKLARPVNEGWLFSKNKKSSESLPEPLHLEYKSDTNSTSSKMPNTCLTPS